MRIFVAAIAIALAACGQPQTPASPDAGAPADTLQARLADNPDVLQTYSGFGSLTNQGAVIANGSPITTPSAPGAWAAMMLFGPEVEVQRELGVRITVQVSRGALQFMTLAEGVPGVEQAFTTVEAGEAQTIYLPVHNGAGAQLVVANGGDSAGTGIVQSVDLVSPRATP